MSDKLTRARRVGASGLLLTSLLLGGCATEQALTEQTQPLQDQIARLEQKLDEGLKTLGGHLQQSESRWSRACRL